MSVNVLMQVKIIRVGNSARIKLFAGRGFYQEWGKAAVEMLPGAVVNIPAGVKHWHGAAPDSWFSHLAVEVPGVETSNEWLEAVSDADYIKATTNKERNENDR